MTSSALQIYLGRRRVGEWGGAQSFVYDPNWLRWDRALPLSLSLPLREQVYKSDARVGHFFDNLLPDQTPIRRAMAARVAADSADDFDLLAKIGRDCVGAFQILPKTSAGEAPEFNAAITAEKLNHREIASLLTGLKRAPLGLDNDRPFRISVAGAQEKTALLKMDGEWFAPSGTTPTTHILKPAIGQLPSGEDMSDSVLNEHFCLSLLAGFQLPTAKTMIEQFDGTDVLVVERFDRAWAGDKVIRLPQEDFCQALGFPSSKKYQSDEGPALRDIAHILSDYSNDPLADLYIFAKANILFWLMGATDGHAKNFSIRLGAQGRCRLTPLYDVISAQPNYDRKELKRRNFKLAMRIDDHHKVFDITRSSFLKSHFHFGLTQDTIRAIFDEIETQTDAAFQGARLAMHGHGGEAMMDAIEAGFRRRLAQ